MRNGPPNPTGMVPKRLMENALREARKGMPSAFKTLHRACEVNEETGEFVDGDVPWSARISAAQAIIDRCLGKPKQEISGTQTITHDVGAGILAVSALLAKAEREARGAVPAEVVDITPVEAEPVKPQQLTDESRQAAKLAFAEKMRAKGE